MTEGNRARFAICGVSIQPRVTAASDTVFYHVNSKRLIRLIICRLMNFLEFYLKGLFANYIRLL